MSGRTYGRGAHRAPAPHDVERAPLSHANDYTPAPAAAVAEGWDDGAQHAGAPASFASWRAQHAKETGWTFAVGRRRGAAAREAVQLAVGVRVAFWAWPCSVGGR